MAQDTGARQSALLCYWGTKITKCFIVINLFWILLSTVIPSVSRVPANGYGTVSEARGLAGSDIYLLIAHPDDEVMFFAPTIIELSRARRGNTVNLVCFSSGNADGLGRLRARELVHSARIFGIAGDKVHQVDDEAHFRDGMNVTWDSRSISLELQRVVSRDGLASARNITLVTFDEGGVSNHANHKSLYYGARAFVAAQPSSTRLFKLDSLSFVGKYSFTVLTNWRLLLNHVHAYLEYRSTHRLDPSKLSRQETTTANSGWSCLLRYWHRTVLFFDNRVLRLDTFAKCAQETPTAKAEKGTHGGTVEIFSDLPAVILSLAAMSFAHDSQMVWFRWGWLLFSRFLNYNALVPVSNL